MNMISKWKIVWGFITGKGVGVMDYVLTVLKNALGGLGDATKAKIAAVLNLAMKVLSIANAVRVFIPVKWQFAYGLTVKAVEAVVNALLDLEITGEELKGVIDGYNKAYLAWMAPDDETCVELVEAPGGVFTVKGPNA